MSDFKAKFLEDARTVAPDIEHRRKINFNISQYRQKVDQGVQQYEDIETAKQRAKNLKWKAISELDRYLTLFETKFIGRGGKITWAQNSTEAVRAIKAIIKGAEAKIVVKSKSMATEEIGLNEALENEGVELYETDLGEYIVQLAGEKPYHIVTPAMHKSKEEIAALFHQKFNTKEKATPKELTLFTRKKLREKFKNADVGITGANFLLADVGGIAITENEGNARIGTTSPRIHIVVVGIEKMLPSFTDLAHMWPLLSTFGTGQRLTVYNTVLMGPKQEGEADGPEEMHVILLDNGRSDLLHKTEQREALYCIRCGACLNACPVYKNVGGHTYNSAYQGPIGAVITPHLRGFEDFGHLSFASSLCGKCTEVCPVKINLHELLLHNRKESVKKGIITNEEKWGVYLWKKGVLNRKLMNLPGADIKNYVLKSLFKKQWGNDRVLPKLAKKSFNQLWKEREKKQEK